MKRDIFHSHFHAAHSFTSADHSVPLDRADITRIIVGRISPPPLARTCQHRLGATRCSPNARPQRVFEKNHVHGCSTRAVSRHHGFAAGKQEAQGRPIWESTLHSHSQHHRHRTCACVTLTNGRAACSSIAFTGRTRALGVAIFITGTALPQRGAVIARQRQPRHAEHPTTLPAAAPARRSAAQPRGRRRSD